MQQHVIGWTAVLGLIGAGFLAFAVIGEIRAYLATYWCPCMTTMLWGLVIRGGFSLLVLAAGATCLRGVQAYIIEDPRLR